MTFRVARWDMLDDSLAFLYARGRFLELTNGECHALTF